ncbi:AAA family ATPase [Candidatus Jorgensenbacteria bacterium]|nr:AAA family ATPase [Candidatus Jorgensenbacteria bacterium]
MTIFLRRLELQGFKSFAQKTVLEFTDRIVAVVGPNGSGKSNIIDALRWVLGEREAKHLRGERIENLIFAGTPKRSAAGFAKVALHFDNRSRIFPVDAEEAMLERKVDRTGVSRMFWQDTEVRLRDITPVLARARLGSRGLTMIGQGESDVFVRSSPDDRRTMIEEILGLREFRLKKTDAERRLASSTVNMEKVRAMLEQLGPHLRLLRRQKHRWDKRSEIASTLTDLESGYFATRYHEISATLKGYDKPLKEDRSDRDGKAEIVRLLEKEIERIGTRSSSIEEGKELREKLRGIMERRTVLERSLARLEAEIEIHAKSTTKESKDARELLLIIEELGRDISDIVQWDDLDKIKARLRNWLHKLETVSKRSEASGNEELTKQVHQIKTELQEIDVQVHDVHKHEDALAALEVELNKEFRSRFQELESKKTELYAIDEDIRNKEFEREKLILKFDEIVREWVAAGHAREELDALPVPQELISLTEVERKILRLRGELAAIGEIDQALVKEAEESETRFAFLTREIEDLEKASHDLKKLIRELDERIHSDFKSAFKAINEAFNTYFRLMFGGGRAHLKLAKREIIEPAPTSDGSEEGEQPKTEVSEPEDKSDPEMTAGVEVELSLPRKKITSLDMLSGGEKTLVSLAALFAFISVSPPPFLVLDEIDAALDEENARRFAELIKEFAKKTQFIIVTHNRATMESADVLYGITMGDDGVSKVLSLKLE